jgi:membrane protein implicated in regulation of membrane protease activity
MTTVRTLKKLLLGETWLLPLGVAAVVVAVGLVVRPLADGEWKHAGGFLLLASVLCVIVGSIDRGARGR